MCRDIELACDEQVIKALDEDEKRAYSTALLACSVNRRAIAACPLAFGEVGVKQRIKNVLNYKNRRLDNSGGTCVLPGGGSVIYDGSKAGEDYAVEPVGNECVEFIKARGIDMPEGFDNDDLGEFVKI